MRPKHFVALVSLAVLPVLAACDSSGDGVDVGSPSPTAPTAPTTAPPTAPPATDTPDGSDWPEAQIDVVIDDGTFDSVAEMGEESDLVVVGEVVEVRSIGRLNVGQDPNAPEHVAVVIRRTETLHGDDGDGDVVLAWSAFDVGSGGERVATRVLNGLRPPRVDDRVLLFLDTVDPAFAALAGGVPTHQLVRLDGITYLDGDHPVAAEVGSSAAAALLTMTLDEIRAEVAR